MPERNSSASSALHPHFELIAVTSEKSAGSSVGTVFPSLAGLVSLTFQALAPEAIAEQADAVFLALPHTKSLDPVAACMETGKLVVDLSADYRLKDPAVYEQWYQTPHTHAASVERRRLRPSRTARDAIAKAKLVASPGCYPTAAILQLAPLFAHDLVQPQTVVIDAKSGISGAGRSPALPYHFPEAHESLEPYKIGQHRHIPEIEQELAGLLQRQTGIDDTGSRCVHRDVHPASGSDESRHSEHGLLPLEETDGASGLARTVSRLL